MGISQEDGGGVIVEFKGKYRFLSNFWPAEVRLDGVVYPTVEHAYQAAKTRRPEWREKIRQCATPGQAKRMGSKVPIRPEWDAVKVAVMKDLLEQKFSRLDLYHSLLATGYEELVEQNTWGDRFWGVCNGTGQNRLGLLLMEIRTQSRKQGRPLQYVLGGGRTSNG